MRVALTLTFSVSCLVMPKSWMKEKKSTASTGTARRKHVRLRLHHPQAPYFHVLKKVLTGIPRKTCLSRAIILKF